MTNFVFANFAFTRITFAVEDPDPGSGAFLTPVSGIWDGENPDPRSDQYF